jgi:hypothetical protein
VPNNRKTSLVNWLVQRLVSLSSPGLSCARALLAADLVGNRADAAHPCIPAGASCVVPQDEVVSLFSFFFFLSFFRFSKIYFFEKLNLNYLNVFQGRTFIRSKYFLEFKHFSINYHF